MRGFRQPARLAGNLAAIVAHWLTSPTTTTTMEKVEKEAAKLEEARPEEASKFEEFF
jgi:hypothetical protein